MKDRADPALDVALRLCRAAAKQARDAAVGRTGASVATLGLLEAEVRAAISAVGEPSPPLAQVEERVRATSSNLTIDLHALLADLGKRADAFQIALFGRTKAGKSTLYAALTNAADAAQAIGKGGQRTTKDIRTYSSRGITFVDVPGICAFGQEGRFDEELARTVVEPADVILFLVTDNGVQAGELDALCQLRQFNKPLILILNIKLDLDDAFFLGRARAGKDGKFDPKTLGEHRRRIDRYFHEQGVGGPDLVIPLHIDAAYRATTATEPDLARWFRQYSRIDVLERALADHAIRRGPFIRVRTYAEPLVRYLGGTIAALDQLTTELTAQHRAVRDERTNALRVMAQLEVDLVARLGELRGVFAPLEAEIDEILDHEPPGRLAAAWSARLDGAAMTARLQALQASLAAAVAAGLAELHRQSVYDAEVLARDLASECAVEGSILGGAGKNWRRAKLAFGVVTGVATVLTGGLAGGLIAVGGLIGTFVLGWLGDRAETQQRRELEASRATARAAMLTASRKKEAAVRATLAAWLGRMLGEASRRRAGRKFDDLSRAIHATTLATRTSARALAELVEDENRALLGHAFNGLGRAAPELGRVARLQGTLTKTFATPVPACKDMLAVGDLLGEPVYAIADPVDDCARVVAALEPARLAPGQVSLAAARGPGQWPTASVRIDDAVERKKATGRRGANVITASRLCRVTITIDQSTRRART